MKKFSHLIPEVVYGGNDGIITTFAIVASFLGTGGEIDFAKATGLVVIVFGLANLFADAVSMGLGNYLSERSGEDNHQNLINHITSELSSNKNNESYIEKTVQVLKERKEADDKIEQNLRFFQSNPQIWADFILLHELDDDIKSHPAAKGLTTALSFIVFGSIPLLPFILNLGNNGLVSIFFTFLALLFLGIVRWLVTKGNFLKVIIEILLVGSLAAAIAYLIGTLFK